MRLFFFVCAVFAMPAAAVARPIVPEDLAKISFVEEPRIPHDGKRIAYVVRHIDAEKDAYRSAIWLAATGTASHARQLMRGESDADPEWSPDGTTLAFVRAVTGAGQIYTISPSGGKAQKLTPETNGAAGNLPLRSYERCVGAGGMRRSGSSDTRIVSVRQSPSAP